MPKTELFDKDAVRKKALHLFWKKGYEATSLTDLTEELGIGKGSFYNTFGSKKQLFNSCLAIAFEGGTNLVKRLMNQEEDPIVGIRKYLEVYCEGLLKDPQSKGCLIVNTSTEMAHDKGIESSLLENNKNMKSAILEYLSKGRLADRASVIADSMLIYSSGVAVLSKYINDRERFKASLDQFMQSIEIPR